MCGVCFEWRAIQCGAEYIGATRATTRVPVLAGVSRVAVGGGPVAARGIGAAAAYGRGYLRFAVECWSAKQHLEPGGGRNRVRLTVRLYTELAGDTRLGQHECG